MRKMILLIAFFSLATGGCATSIGARGAWKTIVEKCVASDLLKDTSFLGQSNVIGPGSIWIKDDDNSYSLRNLLSDISSDGSKVLQRGAPGTCVGTSKTDFSIKAALPLLFAAAKATVDIQASLGTANSVTVTTKNVTTDFLVEQPYEQLILTKPVDDPLRKDLLTKKGRFVIVKAVRVSGFQADFHFDASVAAIAKVKIPANSVVATGPDGAGLSATWTDDKTLSITTPGDFYIAAKFSQWEVAGLGMTGAADIVLVPLNADVVNAKVSTQ